MGIFTEEILKDSSYYQELVEIGRQQDARWSIRELVAAWFPSEDAMPDLDRIQDSERLNDILRLALKAQTAAEIRAAITEAENYCTS
jgi:hypothetical protein